MDQPQNDGEVARMRRDPAHGWMNFTHETRAVADEIVAVLGTRSVSKPSPASQGAGLRAYFAEKWTAASAAARSSLTHSPSQTVWANSRAVCAAVAIEQVPLP
jgi:hypothetical protein